MHILRPGVLEVLKPRPLAQLFPLIGTPLIPVDCIPYERVRQSNVGEDRSHLPKVIGSLKNVSDSASRVQFTREAVLHNDARGEASLLPCLLPHPLHFIASN